MSIVDAQRVFLLAPVKVPCSIPSIFNHPMMNYEGLKSIYSSHSYEAIPHVGDESASSVGKIQIPATLCNYSCSSTFPVANIPCETESGGSQEYSMSVRCIWRSGRDYEWDLHHCVPLRPTPHLHHFFLWENLPQNSQGWTENYCSGKYG